MSLLRARLCSDAIAAGSQPHTYTILSIATVPPTAPVQYYFSTHATSTVKTTVI